MINAIRSVGLNNSDTHNGHSNIHAYIRACMYVNTHTYIYIYVCVCVCIRPYIGV